MDIILQDESGLQLYEKLRVTHPQLQIIFITSYPEKYEEAKKSMDLTYVLYKPIEIEKTITLLKDLKK